MLSNAACVHKPQRFGVLAAGVNSGVNCGKCSLLTLFADARLSYLTCIRWTYLHHGKFVNTNTKVCIGNKLRYTSVTIGTSGIYKQVLQ